MGGGGAASVALSGGHAFVSKDGLRVVDVSDPNHPEVVGGLFGYEWDAADVAVLGDYAYFADGDRFRVVDISNPMSPLVLGAAATPDHALGVAVSGAHAYVAAQTAGLQIIDISDTENPVIVGSTPIPEYATAVAVSGDYAYVGWSGGLDVIDITNPQTPSSVGRLAGLDPVLGVSVLAGHVYVVDDQDWWHEAGHLHVIDVTPASGPVLVGSVIMAGGAYAVAIAESGGHIYADVAVHDLGSHHSLLQVVDVTNPEYPHVVGTSPMTEGKYARGVAVAGGYAYLSGEGFHVIDVTSPQSPQIVGSADTPGWAAGVALSGSYAYIADARFLTVIDISIPQHPWLVGSTLLGEGGFVTHSGNSVAAGDSLVYVATPEGLRILPTQCQGLEPSGLGASPAAAGALRLSAYPEPASRRTTIRLTLPDRGRVRVTLHDVAGRVVRSLYDGVLGAGLHNLSWDGTDGGGRAVPAGIYLAHASTREVVRTARVVILR
jgi:hypothetical protein